MAVFTAVSAVSAGDELLGHAVAILVLGTEAEAAEWNGLRDMLQERTDINNLVSVVTSHNHYQKQRPFGCLSPFTGRPIYLFSLWKIEFALYQSWAVTRTLVGIIVPVPRSATVMKRLL